MIHMQKNNLNYQRIPVLKETGTDEQLSMIRVLLN